MLKIALCGWQLGGTCRPDGQERKRFFLYGMVLLMFWGWPTGTLGNQAVMRLRDVMQQLYRTYQRINIDLPADCRQAAWEFRAHCLRDTRSHYLIILEFDVPGILEAIAPWGLGMYCQDLAETTNAKLKDFYLRFTNRGGSTTDDYQLSALLQTMVHAFLYTHCHIREGRAGAGSPGAGGRARGGGRASGPGRGGREAGPATRAGGWNGAQGQGRGRRGPQGTGGTGHGSPGGRTGRREGGRGRGAPAAGRAAGEVHPPRHPTDAGTPHPPPPPPPPPPPLQHRP